MATKLDWNHYLDHLPGAPKDNQIAAAINIAPSTVSRWRDGQAPNPSHAVAVARAFGNHPINALVAADYFTLDEMDSIIEGLSISKIVSLDDFSTADLAAEVARRLAAGE